MTEKGVYLHDPKSTPAWVRVSGCDIIIGELPPGSLNVGRLGRNWSLETSTGTVYVSGTQEGQMTNQNTGWLHPPVSPGPRKWYVSDTVPRDGISPSDQNNGASYEQPFATIQQAIGASVPERGDMIVMCFKDMPLPVEVAPYTAALVLKFGGVE